jgi:hypothetical protein
VTLYALISWHQLFDLTGVVAVTLGGAYSWSYLRRKDRLRRVERKERQAEYARRHLRWDRDSAEALRCRGGVVR